MKKKSEKNVNKSIVLFMPYILYVRLLIPLGLQ